MSTPLACTGKVLPPVAGPQVRFLVASAGNRFMAELAEMFAEGFAQLGVEAGLEIDRLPPADAGPGELWVVVAPHEYFPLFAVPRVGNGWRQLASGVWCLATEQPGSRCFEAGFRYASACRGVFDISPLGVAEFRRRGVAANYVPLGYTPSAEGPTGEVATRDIDIVFLGHDSPRRAGFLARYAERLARYRCHLLLNDPHEPRRADTPGFASGAARGRLLRRSRVLLNVHAADRPYFEWQRALYAMANGCLVVSEASLGAEPLADGRHLVFAPLEHLMDRCEEYLADENLRQRMAAETYRFLREEFPVEVGCRRMLEAHRKALVGEEPTAEGALWTGRVQRAFQRAAARVRGTWFWLRSARGAVPNRLRRSRVAHAVYYPSKSLVSRLAGRWSLREVQRRRREILARLESAPGAEGPGQLARGYSLCQNLRYRQVATPEISVIVTVYNYAGYLPECLDSVARAAQGNLLGGVEAVIVDDASSDASAEVAAEWLENTPLAACLVRKCENTGLADARNVGLHVARAPLVFILDADNRIFPACLEKLSRALRTGRAAAAYGIIRRFEDASGRGLGLVSCRAWDPARLVAAPYLDAMALFDRATLLKLGGYSTDLLRHGWFGLEDYDLWLKLAQAGCSVAFCPEIVAEYRVHPSSMLAATSHFKPRLVRYFRQKFADLARQYPNTPRLFGWAR